MRNSVFEHGGADQMMGAAEPEAEVAVVGIGNLLLKDEGVGVHALRELRGCAWEGEVKLVDGGTDPWTAFSEAEGCRALVVLDAVVGGKDPGELHRLTLEEVEDNQVVLSLHGISLFHLVRYEALLGNTFDEVQVLGMEPSSVEPGIGLSERCRGRLANFLETARSEVERMLQRLGVV